MFWNEDQRATAISPRASRGVDGGQLRALIDQATCDSEDESDEHAGLLSTIREEVVCPFRARLGGEEVECIRLEWPRNGYGLNAVCRARGRTQTVDIARLEFVDPRPKGHEWIEAYFAWRDLVG